MFLNKTQITNNWVNGSLKSRFPIISPLQLNEQNLKGAISFSPSPAIAEEGEIDGDRTQAGEAEWTQNAEQQKSYIGDWLGVNSPSIWNSG